MSSDELAEAFARLADIIRRSRLTEAELVMRAKAIGRVVRGDKDEGVGSMGADPHLPQLGLYLARPNSDGTFTVVASIADTGGERDAQRLQPGFYWARHKDDGPLTVIEVTDHADAGLEVWAIGHQSAFAVGEQFDLIERVTEPAS